MSETNITPGNDDIALQKEESLLDFTSSSLEARSLEQGQNCEDITVNSIVDAILTKIENKLMGYDAIKMEFQNMRESLDTYSQQMEALDRDIAEIFLDLHNIYKKLERLDKNGRKLCSTKKAVLLRHVKESEDLLDRSRHYLTNDPKEMSAQLVGPPTEVPSIPKVTNKPQ
ncbi:uncharacterized protein LOC6543283 [Drosophila erecta]|uniref:uncharacterized protein LOC6543283 n=1 Tax=Drosophila erecta TaxID=7220 RepID=UPI000177F09C|nr:uncharacterized protein LOC6543283 [Drosophila erecta]